MGEEGKRKFPLCWIAVAVVAGLVIFAPHVFKIRGIQVPVGVTVRGSAVGIGNVVQVRNTSSKTLTGVVVTAKNRAAGQTATYRIGTIPPGGVAEIGWMEWDWRVVPGETVTVSAKGYFPIIFTSEELGIR